MSEAIARAFNQWNKMLIDQQQWDVARAERNDNFEIQKMMFEEEAKDRAMQRENLRLGMQAKEQQIALAQQQVDNLKEFQTPREMSLYPLVGDDWYKSSEGRQRMAMLFSEHGRDVTVSPADGVLMDGGRRIPISAQEVASKLSMMDLINRSYRNMPEKIMAQRDKAQQAYEHEKKQYNIYSKQPESRFYPLAAKHKANMATAQARIDKANQALTNEAQAAFNGREAGDYEKAAAYFRRFGHAAADQVQWLEKEAEKFRHLQNTYLAASLKYNKPDKPTTMYVLNNDPYSGEYKKVKRQYQVYPTTDQSKLIAEDGSEILTTSPNWMSDKERGVGEGAGKTPSPMTQDMMRDNIVKRYQIAMGDPSMGPLTEVTAGAVFAKRSTHEQLADRIGLMLEAEGAKNPFGTTQPYADNIMNKMELRHGKVMDKVESFGEDMSFNAHAKELGMKLQTETGRAELKKGDPRNIVIAKYGEAVAKKEANAGIEGFREWWNAAWKTEFINEVYNITQGGVIMEPEQIYTPNEITRKMEKLMTKDLLEL